MTSPTTIEATILSQAFDMLDSYSDDIDERLNLIELIASIHSGFPLEKYHRSIRSVVNYSDSQRKLAEVLERFLVSIPIPFELSISALAREPLTVAEQKKNGVFYTDYRLSLAMASESETLLCEDSSVADLSAGTGILLAGIAASYKSKFPSNFDSWLAKKLYAFDLSENALRGATAALMSMTDSLCAIKSMNERWSVCDSLFNLPKDARFDLIIGNPPWGKIKLSRPAFMARNGDIRVYGSDYSGLDLNSFKIERDKVISYSSLVKKRYPLLSNAETNTYMAFLLNAIEHLTDDGRVLYLVPAGLIRSSGAEALRNHLVKNSSELKMILFDNRPKYFSIDSRFKFVLIDFTKDLSGNGAQKLEFIISTDSFDNFANSKVIFNIDELRKIRSDLTIPEVSDNIQRNLFYKMCSNGICWGQRDSVWEADFCRELDMTSDKSLFHPALDGLMPLVEGRMVQQYRFSAKAYQNGSGRSACWVPNISGCHPQFTVNPFDLPDKIHKRVQSYRVGFCDIAGQTNERAMMSTIIPPGVVCGNKVPTIVFSKDSTGDLAYLWVGITNTFIFDWMLRRIISTTVNYFHLLSLPLPNIDLESETAKRIIELVKSLVNMDSSFYTDPAMENMRAEIEALVANAYGLDAHDMKIIISDFPLVDKKQPRIEGSEFSFTFALIMSKLSQSLESNNEIAGLVEDYRTLGARAFIPSEMTSLCR